MSEPVWFRPHRHLCGEAAMRDAMDDGEFWAHVFAPYLGDGPDGYDPDDDWNAPESNEPRFTEPCPECGAAGTCSYDAEGRPLVHAVTDEPDDFERLRRGEYV